MIQPCSWNMIIHDTHLSLTQAHLFAVKMQTGKSSYAFSCRGSRAQAQTLAGPRRFNQSEKFLDLGTVTRPPSSIYARVNCFVICNWCTRVQGHPRNLFRRVLTTMEFRAFVVKAPHLTIPRQRTLVDGGKLIFSNAAAKLPKAISQKRHDGFSFLNDGNLDKCLSKKEIRLATPALWLSSPH